MAGPRPGEYEFSFSPIEVAKIMEFARKAFPGSKVIYHEMSSPAQVVPISREHVFPFFPNQVETMVIAAKNELFDYNDGVVQHVCRGITDKCLGFDEQPSIVVIGLMKYYIEKYMNIMTCQEELKCAVRWAIGSRT